MDIGKVHAYLLEHTSNGVIIIGADGKIEAINPAAAAMLTLSPTTVVGISLIVCFADNLTLLGVCRHGTNGAVDIPLPRRRLAAAESALLDDGRRIVLLHDVTEARALESRRESMSSTIAHDLRNPISALLGYAELVAHSGDLNADQHLFMTRLRQTITKLHDAAGALVDLAWLEAGMPLNRQPVALQDVIAASVDALAPMAQEGRISVEVSVQTPLSPALGDPAQLRLVIDNLLRNAVLYSEPDQVVTVRAWSDAGEVCCSVADQGIGIADDEIDLIFDRMFRSRDERVRALSGGGVGLSIVRRALDRHGGSISVSSSPGMGSTFEFRLPAVET